MAKLALVYGVRLLPADELESVGEAPSNLKNGRKASVTMHLIEGAASRKFANNCSSRSMRSSNFTRKSKLPAIRRGKMPVVL